MASERTVRRVQWLWNVWLWIGLGLAFAFLNRSAAAGPASPYMFLELVLFAAMVVALWANTRFELRRKIPLSRKLAPWLYVALVWLFGMAYEASLTVNGEGIGGIHPQTLPSYILAQGDYVPIAIVSLWVIRKTRAGFRETFFFAGGKSLTEGLIFTGMLTATLMSPTFWLSPLVLAYYTLVYASFIALPLLLVDERLLWDEPDHGTRYPVPFFWLAGFVLAFCIRIFWGLIYSPAATWMFNLPANSVP